MDEKLTYFDLLKMTDEELLKHGFKKNQRGGLTKINAKLPNAFQNYETLPDLPQTNSTPVLPLEKKRKCCGG